MIQETYPMMVGDMEVLNERILLTQVENGLLMNGLCPLHRHPLLRYPM